MPANIVPMEPATPEPLWTMQDVAEHLGVHTESVRRMIARGELRAYRYGRRVIRVRPSDVAAMARPLGNHDRANLA